MKKVLFPMLFLAATLCVVFFAACSKNEAISTDDAIDQALFSVQERGSFGKFGCFELVFPVSVTMPDGTTTIDAASYDALKSEFRSYFEANGGRPSGGRPQGGGYGPGNRPRPTLVLPISVISQEGETITVETEDELRALRAECGGSFGQQSWQGHSRYGLSCFDVVFPVTISFPDSSTASAASGPEIGQLVRTWRQNNPGTGFQDRPTLVFPISVLMKTDGSTVVLNSKEELIDLKKGCQ